MLDSTLLGTFLVLIGGISTGCFPFPMKFTRNWAWENVWLLYSIVGLLAVPWLVALAKIPDLMAVYGASSLRTLVLTALFGFGWGVGNVLFGEAVALVGMALTFAIVGGLCAAVGSLIPLVLLRPERLIRLSGLVIMLGVIITVCGVAILGAAGREREKKLTAKGAAKSVVAGLLLCVASGFLGSMLNFSFAFGSGIAREAVKHGVSPGSGSHAIWAIAFLGGFASNGGYAALKLMRNRSWSRFREYRSAVPGLLSALMGVLFCAGFLLYGQGATLLGVLGPVVGWPVFQATTIMASTAVGAASGEWRGADKRFVCLNILGLAILVSAIVVLSIGNRL
jgi:L-rhamnose-H+ transport protein